MSDGNTRRAQSAWTAREIKTLRELVDKGLTGPRIAELMGRSRGSVMGKCDHLGLRIGSVAAVSEAVTLHRMAERRRLATEVAPAPQRLLPAAPTRCAPVLLTEAGFAQCRFPTDLHSPPAADMPVCGAPTIVGLSWCEACAARVFNRPREAVAKLASAPPRTGAPGPRATPARSMIHG